MVQRPSVVVKRQNRSTPSSSRMNEITVEIRIYAPEWTTLERVLGNFDAAVSDAVRQAEQTWYCVDGAELSPGSGTPR